MESKSGEKSKVRKKRTTFTNAINLEMIKLCVEHECSPTTTKKEVWDPIVSHLNEKFDVDIGFRVAQKKVNELLKKYKQDQLVYKTGTEEEQSEMMTLLETLAGQTEQEELVVPIPVYDIDEVDEAISPKLSKDPKKKERVAADEERDGLVTTGFAPEPTGIRRKRTMMSFDEEMIKAKQDHDSKIEIERLDLEKMKSEREYEIERKRIKLEEDRLKAAAEESKRKDDLQSQQLKLQQEMFELMKMMANK